MWHEPTPIRWIGHSPEKHFKDTWKIAKSVKTSTPKGSPINSVSSFAMTRMERQISAKIMGNIAMKATLHSTPIISLSGRVALRTLPVVGWALLAYDVYTLGDAIYDWYSDDS